MSNTVDTLGRIGASGGERERGLYKRQAIAHKNFLWHGTILVLIPLLYIYTFPVAWSLRAGLSLTSFVFWERGGGIEKGSSSLELDP